MERKNNNRDLLNIIYGDFVMTVDDVVKKFNTTPFLFIGSGITRRYYNLPDWRGLLEHFAREVNNDEFSYSLYENRANKMEKPVGLLPTVAKLIQADYDEKWFKDESIRYLDSDMLNQVKEGVSPFKAEVASYIKRQSNIVEKYKTEIQMLSELSIKNIAGVITTNYDSFIEDHFNGYKKYVGQKPLIFSAIQGIAEIFKIHGSIESPDSLIINEQDYIDFEKQSAYLAAKLMTIFMEYPIVFVGYSISDSNIQRVLKSIVDCLDMDQLKLLADRFVFVEYQEGKVGAEVSPYTIMIGEKLLSMCRIIVDDFRLVFRALEAKKSKLPVRILRRFKQELYDFTVTSIPTANLRVASIEDNRVADEELVMAIGRYSDYGLKGLHGLQADEWYRNIILHDLDFSADDLLKYAFDDLIKQNSGRLPLNKYLAEATGSYTECEKAALKQDFNFIISNTIRKHRGKLGMYSSVKQIWDNEKSSYQRATDLIAHLPEDKIEVKELGEVLEEIFEKDANVLHNSQQSVRTNIKRLIRLYDYMKWGKKEPSN